MTAELSNLTPYRVINRLLAGWVEGVKRILGDKVIGLYLSGSLSYGDFVPGRSDIDLQAVVRSPLTEDELKSVERLHKEIERRCPEWANRIECSYPPLELMRDLSPPEKPRPWWGFGSMYAAAPAGNEWIINHYLLATYGIALDGPDFRELVPPISIQDVRQASARDLSAEWLPKFNDSLWLSNSHHQSYLVLNLCRILRAAIGGVPGSKKAAADWVKATYPEWTDLIEEAERWTYGDEMKRRDDAASYIRFAVEKVNEFYTPNAF